MASGVQPTAVISTDGSWQVRAQVSDRELYDKLLAGATPDGGHAAFVAERAELLLQQSSKLGLHTRCVGVGHVAGGVGWPGAHAAGPKFPLFPLVSPVCNDPLPTVVIQLKTRTGQPAADAGMVGGSVGGRAGGRGSASCGTCVLHALQQQLPLPASVSASAALHMCAPTGRSA